ncbi:ATP-binding protein [Streptomyces sp. NPDC050560]|uniref:ATP-binding protein n=1 Tax=Streptomyces sp. NPDC050560 TaxID=3365630 RepID=UPI0037A2B435
MSRTLMRHGFRVASTSDYVPLARRETRKILVDWGISEPIVADACLIITELVTNVVRHAAVVSPTAAVSLAVEDGPELVLAVADAHPFKPKPLPLAHALGGRGLFLVNALVREAHGTTETVPDAATGGKRITVRLPLSVVSS